MKEKTMINKTKYSYIGKLDDGFMIATSYKTSLWTYLDKTGKELWKPFINRFSKIQFVNNKRIALLNLPNNKYSIVVVQDHKRIDCNSEVQAEKLYNMIITKERLI